MKTILSALISLGLFASCSHTPKDSPKENREPSNANFYKDTVAVKRCGEIQYSEDNYSAKDQQDLAYTLMLDCNSDRKINKADHNLVISIPLEHLKPQQKSWLTRWKQQAVQVAKNPKANPYLCLQVQALEDPCVSGRSAYGVQPHFTSKIYNIQETKR